MRGEAKFRLRETDSPTLTTLVQKCPALGLGFPWKAGVGVVHRRRLRPCGRGVDLGLDRAAVRIRTTAPEAPKRVGRWSGRPVPAQEAAPDPLRSPSRWMI